MRYLEFPDLGNEDRFPYSQETCKVTASRKGSKINDTAYYSRSNPNTGVLRQKLSLKLVDFRNYQTSVVELTVSHTKG